MRTRLTILVVLVAALLGAPAAAAGPGAPRPAVSISASVSPGQAPPGAAATYTDTLTNSGDVAGSGVQVAHTLPAGFSYVAGSASVYRDGILIGSPDPLVSGRTLIWSGLTVSAQRGGSFFGVNTMVQERCEIGYATWQLDHVRKLMGDGAWAKQLFYGITAATDAPEPCWGGYINAAYDRGLKPVIRLAGIHDSLFWHKPQPDRPGNYTSIAQAFGRVVAQLPRRDGHTLYVQLWNEPNLNIEWSGAANPTEYGQFLAQTAAAIRAATGADPRVAILNAPLAPGGDIAPATFMQQMFERVPDSRWSFDLWAAHSYPGNYPPELNMHRGQAVRSDVSIDSYVSQVQILAANGRPALPVFLSETGYLLGHHPDRRYPPVSEANRGGYMSRAFDYYWRAWPELIGVAPYELSDPSGVWSGWNWVEADGSQHGQYGSVQALDKSAPSAASQLTLKFQARAASTAGIYASDIEVSADNFDVSPQYGVAPLVVISPTPAIPLTPSATALSAVTATPTAAPTLTPTGTPSQAATATPTGTPVATATPTPSGTPAAAESETPSPTAAPAATETPSQEATAAPTASATPSGTPAAAESETPSPTATRTSTWTLTSTSTGTASPTATAARTITPTRTQGPAPSRTGAPPPTSTPVAVTIGTVWVGPEPHGLTVANERGAVYAALHRAPVVSVIDGSTGGLVRSISLGSASGGNGIAYDPASDRLFVANEFTANVSRADAAAGALPAAFPVRRQPAGLAMDPDTGIAYVANFGGNTISMLDGDTGLLLGEAPGGGEPSFIVLDPRRGRFYVTNHLGATIGVHDLVSGARLKTLPTGSGPYGIALDAAAGRLYTADRYGRSVTVADIDNDSIVKHMPLDCAPYQVAVNPASGHLFVVCADDRQMHIYDTDSTRWLAWVPVGRGAQEGIVVDAATGRVYVSNGDDNTVSIIQDSGAVNPPTLVPTRTPTIAPTPTATPTSTATATATATPTPRPPGPPDAHEPDDAPIQAGLLVGGAPPAEHTFHRAGDIDWAAFTVATPGHYLFRTVAAESIRAALAIYAPDGATLLAEVVPPPGSTTAHLAWLAAAPGEYYLRVREPDGRGGIGAYYWLDALALSDSLYLPLIGRGEAVAAAEAVSRTDVHAAAGDPANLVLAGDGGTIYVSSPERRAVLALDATTSAVRAIATGFQQPGGLALLHDAEAGDRLLVADTLAGTVRVLAAGDLHTLAETYVGPGPYAVAAATVASDAAGRVFVALTGGDEVVVLDAAGTPRAATHLGGLGFPQGLAVDPIAGLVYVSYALSPRYGQIAALDGVTGALVRLIPPTLDRPLAGAGRLAINWSSSDPPERLLLIDTAMGVVTYNLDSGTWVDARSAASQ